MTEYMHSRRMYPPGHTSSGKDLGLRWLTLIRLFYSARQTNLGPFRTSHCSSLECLAPNDCDCSLTQARLPSLSIGIEPA
jgi:hypothetical protein